MRRDRVISQDRVILLQQVAEAEQRQAAEDQDRDDEISTTLWSAIPMPISSTVTTQQIVRMMKRGENGVISVSMDPPAIRCRVFFRAALHYRF